MNVGDFDIERCLLCQQELWTLKANFQDYERFHTDQHRAIKDTLDASERVLEERLKRMNEFREEARTVQQTYVRHDLYELAHERIANRLSTMEGTLRGISIGLSFAILASLAATILGIFGK